eukprot:403343569
MAQPFTELKEPLISSETKENLNQNYLKSFLQNKYKDLQSQTRDKQEEEEQPVDVNEELLENKNEEVVEPGNKGYVHKLIDFKSEMKDLVQNTFTTDPQHKDFYLKATAHHEMPNLKTEQMCLQKNNPNIFAVLSEASSLFKHIELKEYMCLSDYKAYTSIRVRNYISLLRMLSKIDSSDETYQQIKKRLYQVKRLVGYLGLDFEKMYERLHKNLQIHNLSEDDKDKSKKPSEDGGSVKDPKEEAEDPKEDEEEENDEDKEEKSNKDDDEEKGSQDGSQKDDEEKEEEEDDSYGDEDYGEEEAQEVDDDQDYINFFKESTLPNQWEYSCTSELEREEKFWQNRAEWLDNMLENFQNKEETKAWAPWFQAKLEELADLDIPVKNVETQQSSQIFYLFDFLEEQISKVNPKTEYLADQKVYPEQNNVYPTIKLDSTYINQNYPCRKVKFNVREKLCRKISSREQQTDYIITIFERKAFGPEKIYERRINVRGLKISQFTKFELHPNGGYLYMNFNLEYPKSESIQLVFALNAQFKEPKLLKMNSEFIGFYDKSLFMLNHVKQKIIKEKKELSSVRASLTKKNKKDADDMQLVIEEEETKHHDSPTKQGEEEDAAEEEEDEYEQVYRVYEYDLIDFAKVKFTNLKSYGQDFQSYELSSGSFGRIRDGFFYKKVKYDNDQKFYNYEVFIRNDLYTMEPSDKYEAANLYENMFQINEKGDKALFAFWKDGALSFMKYNIDPKDKKIKKEGELKLKNESLNLEKGKCEFKIASLFQDFMIMFKLSQAPTTYFYLNENQITTFKTELKNPVFYFNDKGLQSILIQQLGEYEALLPNAIRYNICEMIQDKEKKEWTWSKVNIDIFNQHYEICYPYAFCIYNHDQVYMKDLTHVSLKGYYYMNHFMAIQPGMRPLTIYSLVYNNKISLNVPVINSNYTPNDFNITFQQIKSFYQMTNSFKFQGLIRYRTYCYNQDILAIMGQWSGVVDNQGKLHKEIKIQAKYNSLYIEQWKNGKCIQRLIISHFHKQSKRQEPIREHSELQYRSYGQWCIINQKMEGSNQNVSLYVHEMDGSFQLPELLSLDSVWDYSDDDQSNEIYGVYIDSLVQGRLDIYLMYANCLMRKFTSALPDYDQSTELQIEESPLLINLEYIFKGKGKENAGGDKTQTAKKTNLYEQFKGDIFIANSIFYSQEGIVDLSAQNIENKYLVGVQITNINLTNIKLVQKFTYSYNEARLAAFYKSNEVGNPYEYYDKFQPKSSNGMILMVCPLYNTRVIPQFDHRRFRHPVIPIIDKQAGCLSVFTLSMKPQSFEDWGQPIKPQSFHRKKMNNRLVNLYPGLIIKYFNGIEEQVPLHMFGEEFLDILRFRQSQNGKFVTILGTRVGDLEDRFYDQTFTNRKYQRGIFLYRVKVNSVQLIKSFLLAEKDIETIEDISLRNKMINSPEKIREYVEPELPGPQVGDYDNDYLDNDGKQEYAEITDEIDFMQNDEVLVDELRQKRQKELAEKKKLEESQRRKSGRTRNVKQDSVSSPVRASVRENLLHSGDYEESHVHLNTEPVASDQPAEKPEDEEFPNVVRIQGMKQPFKGLDIPYIQASSYFMDQVLNNRYQRNLVREITREDKKDDEEVFTYDEEKMTTDLFEYEQSQKISQIHFNMVLDVNEHGHIFMINRLNNTLYFFYECHGEHKLAKLKFEPNFVITSADSSRDYLVVTAKEKLAEYKYAERYRVLDIKPVLECETHARTFDLNSLTVVFDSKTHETSDVKKEIVGVDEYIYQIEDCRIHKHLLILQIVDNSTRLLKVFDLRDKIMTYYLEGQTYMLSGCKRFVWIQEDNVVYDLENGLSTFFFWPGDQINTHSYDAMDNFNITEDRTIMVTQGYLQLAFNLLSMEVDDELANGDYQQPQTVFFKSNKFQYLCYKISDYKSVLERAFMADYDKQTRMEYNQYSEEEERAQMEADELKSDEEKKNSLFEHQTFQNKQISNLLAYISEKFNEESLDHSHITNFFFSFYSIDKSGIKGGSEKNPVHMNIFQKMYSLTMDKRVDLIEDILHYVVECKTVPITQTVINSCFTNFLLNANTSLAFQNYLNNITVQTIRMKDLEKFQITSNDLGFVADSHDSPIMDDRFYTKFRQPKETKKDVEISYINLGKLLSEQGEEIMDKLSDKKYLAIMDIPFIKYLVMYQWLQVKHTIHNKLLYPFFVMLGLFTVYCLNIDFKEVPDEKEWYQQMFNWIFAIILFNVLSYFFYVEVIQFIKDPKDYFTDFWNFSDLFSYTLCLLVVLFDRIPSVPNSVNRPIASLCLIILWIKLFYFLRVFESTSRLIRMIIEIVNDMKNFLMVLTIGIIGFSGGFYILQQGLTQEADGTPGNVFMSIIYSYRLAQGDFQLDFFDQLNTVDYILAWFLFVTGSLFLVIVLLNLLIAIMGDTFSRVLENITNLSVREKVMLVSENESLFDRQSLFKSAQFLIIINEKNLDSVQADNWDGQINALKRQVLDKVSSLQTDLDAKITENQKELKKRINDQDDRAKKQGAAQEQRIQGAVKTEFVDAIVKINEQFSSQQSVLKIQQTMAADQMKVMRMLQEQIEQLRNDQSKLSQFVQKAIVPDGKNLKTDADDE